MFTRIFQLTCIIITFIAVLAYAQDSAPIAPNYKFSGVKTPDSPYKNTWSAFQTDTFSGSFTYQYKIEAPPGTNGLTPEISLSYNSHSVRGTAGWIGAGWSIPLSYIQRDIEYTRKDTSDDTFDLYLSGAKHDLIHVPIENQYHTKIESFLKIEKRYGAPNEHSEYWVVTTKNGTEYRFGYNPNSENKVNTSDPEMTPYIWRWSLDRIKDPNGNCIYLTYTETPSNGEIYLSRIEYNTERKRAIEFILENRPDSYLVIDQGSEVRETRILKEIRTSVNGTPARKYKLNHVLNEAQNKALLTSVTQYGKDGVSSLPPVKFEYNTPHKGFDSATSWNTPGNQWIRKTQDDSDMIADTFDANGDGFPDYVKSKVDGSGKSYWKIYLSTKSGFQNSYQKWRPYWRNIRDIRHSEPEEGDNTRSAPIDFNRDGYIDAAQANSSSELGITWNTGSGYTGVTWWKLPVDNAWIRKVRKPGSDLSDPHAPNLEQAFMDMNGDGLPDIVRKNNNRWEIWRNTGKCIDNPDDPYCFEDFGTWKVYHPDAWLEEVEKDDSDVRVTTYDMNGDGLTDIIWGDNDNDRWRVCINTGSNFLSPADWTPPGMNDEDIIDIEDHDNKEKANDTKRNLADINGDGLPDVVHARDDGKNWDVYFNKGNGFTGSKDWYSHFDTKYVRDITYDDEDESKVRRDMFDITGDGLPDIVQRTDQGHWNVYANHYTKADLLVKITDTLGGIAETDYTASANFSNTRLPFNYWLVASVTTNNNMAGPHSNISSRNFSYNGGLYDFSTREFRGFATVTETLPNTSEIIHYYHQDEGKKGKEIKSEVKSASGKPYSAMETIWNASETNGVYTTLLNRKDEHTFDGTPVNPKIVRTEYKNYDKYGNIGLEIYHGDIGTSADNLYAYNEYWPSCGGDNQISDRLKKQYVKASSGGPRLRESFFWYDHLTNCVYKGNLTREEAWLDIGENPVTTHEYDDYGNRIQTVDPEKRMAKTEYDPVYHTFPEKIYNAKKQLATRTYDPASGNLLDETDPNEFTTRYTYDVFHRKVKEIRPYDTEALPTTMIQYLIDGTPPESVITAKRETSGLTGTLDIIQFIDGFGNLIQTKTEFENPANKICADVFYDNMGRVEKQSNPYLADNSQNYSTPDTSVPATAYGYDIPGRPIAVNNPDGTGILRKFVHWTVTEVDENKHSKSYKFDSQQRLLEVKENNKGESYFTRYQYKPTGELHKITDHLNNVTTVEYDSLGRKTGMSDPDMGEWSYEYDSVGNLILQTDARKITTHIKYDTLNRKTLVNYPSDADIYYTYDLDTIGTLSQILDGSGIASYTYDQRFRKIQETRSIDEYTWTTKWSYDAMDRIKTHTYPDEQVVIFNYNAQGKPESIPGIVTGMDYNAKGQLAQKTCANGLDTVFSYYPLNHRLEQIKCAGIQDFEYSYDDVGNILSIKDKTAGLTETFTYDDLDRLATAGDSEYSAGYEYNAIGNLEKETNDGVVTGYNYGENAGPHAVTGKNSQNPVIGSFALQNASIYITVPEVTLNNIAFGSPSEYMASEDKTFADASWKPYSEAPEFTLSSGYGLKTVFFKVKNSDGESDVKSDSIEFLFDTDKDAIPDKYDDDDDNDGIPDTWELEHGMNPLDPTDALDDYDGDRLNNLEEYKYGSDINIPDSDGDGISDYDEVYVHKTDPANPDTDGDGITDDEDPKPRSPFHYPESDSYSVIKGNFNEGGGFRNSPMYTVLDSLGKFGGSLSTNNKNWVSGIVDSSGGTVGFSDGCASVTFPPNAVSQPLTITIIKLDGPATPPSNGGFVLIGTAYEFTAKDSDGNPVTVFDKPVEITIKYHPAALGPIDESDMSVHYYDEASKQWVPVSTTVDTANHNVTATTYHFTKFAILAPEHNHPPEIVSTPETSADINKQYQYDVEAEDSDNDLLTFQLVLFPEGMVIDSESGLVTWTPDSSQEGEHDVEVRVSDGSLVSKQYFTIAVSTAEPRIIHSSDGHAWITVIPGDAMQDLNFNIKVISAPPANEGFIHIGNAYEISVTDIQGTPVSDLGEKIAVTLEYNSDEVMCELYLNISFYDELSEQWAELPSSVDKENHTVTAETYKPGKFAIFEPRISCDPGCDGNEDCDDFCLVKFYINQPASECPECDIDGDGTVTIMDIRKLVMMCPYSRCTCN